MLRFLDLSKGGKLMPTHMKCKECEERDYTAAALEKLDLEPCEFCGGEKEIIFRKEGEE